MAQFRDAGRKILRFNLMQNAIHHLRLIRPLLLWLLIWLSIGACTLVGEQIELTPTPTLPTVEFLFPENNAQVFEGTDLTLDIVARDSVGGIGRVELFVDELSDGEPYREVSPDEIAQIEPALQGDCVGGFYTDSDSTGDIHKFSIGLADWLERQ
ncbi:MAG: Ig-like domain-containing protein, partial [Chloroflexota bacterium]